MDLADALTSAARKQGGLTVLDLSEDTPNIDYPVPRPDLTDSVWPMKDDWGWWMVRGFAGKHRKDKRKWWLSECLTCGYERPVRVKHLLGRNAYCNHRDRSTTTTTN